MNLCVCVCVCTCTGVPECLCVCMCGCGEGRGPVMELFYLHFLFQELPCHGVTVVFVELGDTKIEVS